MKLPVFGFVASNFNYNLWCRNEEDARCLALLNPAFGRATRGGIQQGEVSACPPSRAAPFGPSSSTLSSLPKGSWPRAGEAGGDTGYIDDFHLFLSSIEHPVSSI